MFFTKDVTVLFGFAACSIVSDEDKLLNDYFTDFFYYFILFFGNNKKSSFLVISCYVFQLL